MTLQNKIMVDITNPLERKIYVGWISVCPIPEKVGLFAYHVQPLNGEEQTDRDFNYFLPDDESLVAKINDLKTRYPERIILSNGIPKGLCKGWVPEYRFLALPNMEFKEIKRITDLESKL